LIITLQYLHHLLLVTKISKSNFLNIDIQLVKK
jgi:hypothetical protein